MNKRVFGKHLAALFAAAAVIFVTACSMAREAAPEASYVLLSGAKESTQSMKGRVYIVNFWATSCAVCVKEMPEVARTYRRFASRGFDVMSVAMSYDAPAYVVDFAVSRQLPFKVALDTTGEVAKAFGGVNATPTSYLIDRQGRIVKHWLGEPDFAVLQGEIEALLNSPV